MSNSKHLSVGTVTPKRGPDRSPSYVLGTRAVFGASAVDPDTTRQKVDPDEAVEGAARKRRIRMCSPRISELIHSWQESNFRR